jgi:hypothetical protein
MYQMGLWEKQQQLPENEKEKEKLSEALQALLSARKTFGTQMGGIIFGGIIFVFAGGVFCGKCRKTIEN